MLGFFLFIQIISGVFLIFFILLHSPKGMGFASIGDAAQLFSGQKSVEAGLNKITALFSVVFIVTSLLLGFHIIK